MPAQKAIVSGSANFLLKKNISGSLAGRAVYFNLLPLNRRELKGGTVEPPFIKKVFRGAKYLGDRRSASTPHCIAGILAYNGSIPVNLGSKLWAIPLDLLLS